MNERITEQDVARVAKLALLRLEDEELGRFTGQLGEILDHASELQGLDLEGLEPMARPVPLSNVMRSDEVGPVLDRAEVLGSAPLSEDGQFRVPPVLGGPR